MSTLKWKAVGLIAGVLGAIVMLEAFVMPEVLTPKHAIADEVGAELVMETESCRMYKYVTRTQVYVFLAESKQGNVACAITSSE